MKRAFIIIHILTIILSATAQDFHFAFDMGSTGSDFGRDIAVSGNEDSYNGTFYVTGTHTGTVDFDPSLGVTTRTSAGMQDVFIASYDSSGNLLWVTDFGGSLNDAPNAISVSSSGIYVTGLFRGTVDFDPGFGSALRTASGDADIFLVKFDFAGNLDWAITMGGNTTGNNEAGIGLYADENGWVYLTGVFEGAGINFDPNGGAYFLNSIGDQNIFLAKYNSGAVLQWAQSIGSTTLNEGGGYSITSDGTNIFVGGSFAGTCDFNPNGTGGTLISAGNQDGFIASYTPAGTYRWARRIGGPLFDEVIDIDADRMGNIGLTGSVFGNVTYAGGNFSTNGGSSDAFVAQISEAGTFNWAFPLGGAGANDKGYAITVSDCGKMFVGGRFCSTADFNPGAGTANLTGPACGFPNPDYSYFIAAYDINGNYQWAEGGSSTSGDSEIWGLALDACESLLATGGYNQTQDFNITAGTTNLVPAGSYDAFVSKHYLPQIIVSSSNRRELIAAIHCANNHIGRDSIVFCIPGAGPHVFNMDGGTFNSGALPYITDDYTIIDGTTQPGWTLGEIVVNGAGLVASSYGFRFDGCDYGEVIGISVRDFPNHGIYAYNANHVNIQDCHSGGNVQDGIRFFNSAYGNVQGSKVGIAANGFALDANGRDGIATNGSADYLQIGGTTLNEANFIGGNTRYGIYLRTDHNQVEGNYIGTGGFLIFSNGDNGIYIEGEQNRIGGTNANQRNFIAYNGGHGIEVGNTVGYIQNQFRRNAYYCNTQTSIEINTANQGILPPVISLATVNNIYGTGVPGSTVEVYAPDSSGCAGPNCQGRYYLGAANVDGTGNWSLSGSFNLGQQAVALQTDANLNTSEFSTCQLIQGPLNIQQLALSGAINAGQVKLSWNYSTLPNSALFQIERRTEARDWEIVTDLIAPAGASQSELTDSEAEVGTIYYRVGQWMENGEMFYSNVIEIQPPIETIIQIYPNPASEFFRLNTSEIVDQILIFDMKGKEVLRQKILNPTRK
jgi:hypothetical protein